MNRVRIALALAAAGLAQAAGLPPTDPGRVELPESRLPISFDYQAADWNFDAYLARQRERSALDGQGAGPGYLLLRGRPIRLPGPPPGNKVRNSAAGWDSLHLGLTRSWLLGEGDDAPMLDLRSGLRLSPADDERSLLPGRPDWSLSATLSRGFGYFNTGITAGRSWLGRRGSLAGRDVWFGDLYLGFQAGDSASVGLDYAYTQAGPLGGDTVRSLNLLANFRLDRDWRLSLNASRDLSSNDPGIDLSASVRYQFR
ncbi:hypothetical protein [Chitinimonas lacunae]|uniref:Transporter n=1 Tax=Chitinimonas lacunae TaxID=1963018 RepID=A0ABV8MRX7_9NEIS